MLIEIVMTFALILYFMAYFVARKGGKYWWTHVLVALSAFILDAYGTYQMYLLDLSGAGWVTVTHTSLTLLAISLFFVQAFLGVTRQRDRHIFFAKNIFLPMWVISFFSGFLYIL